MKHLSRPIGVSESVENLFSCPDISSLQEVLLHQFFTNRAKLIPSQAALIGMDDNGEAVERLSYSLLADRAARLALRLQAVTAPGDRIIMLLPRGIAAIEAQIAILMAGCAFVPIDIMTPPDRIAFIAEDSGAQLVVTTHAQVDRLASLPIEMLVLNGPGTALDDVHFLNVDSVGRAVDPEGIAYIIYTSGSTGKPKGVMVRHRNACHFVRAEGAVLDLKPNDLVYQGFSYGFDMSIEEIWPALAAGATLLVGTEAMARSGPDLAAALARANVTVWHAVPSLVGVMDADIPSLRLLNVGGEACPSELVRRWWRPGRRILNTYGPTETTVSATFAELTPDQPITIGRPLPGYEVFVCDEALQPVPDDMPGELCIAGEGVSAGYVNRPELTREKFRHVCPFPGNTTTRPIYRTGDLVRRSPDGEIVFLGRIDTQVKIHGYRVELGEIEDLMLRRADVGAAAVSLYQQDGMPDTLVAYLVPRAGAKIDRTGLKAALGAALPPYMVPTVYEVLDLLPTLSSGKIDRNHLPAPRRATSEIADHTGFGTEIERAIAEAMAATLAIAVPGAASDFFEDLGGHSLAAARLISRLRRIQEMKHASVRDIYQGRSPCGIAALLKAMPSDVNVKTEPFRPISRRRHLLCAIGQALVLPFVFGKQGLSWLLPVMAGLIVDQHGGGAGICMAAGCLATLVMGPALLALPVLVKPLVGRFDPGDYPMWGATYFRWWVFDLILRLTPLRLIAGTPVAGAYWRLLGARIGKGALISSTDLDVPDLIQIGDRATLGGGVILATSAVEYGLFRLGHIEIAADATVGIGAVIGRGGRVGTRAVLGDLSMLPTGGTIPDGETWDGSPAQPVSTESSLPPLSSAGQSSGVGSIAGFIGLSGLLGGIGILWTLPGLGLFLLLASHWSAPAIIASAPLFALAYVLSTAFLTAAVKWLMLGRVAPGRRPYWGRFHRRLWFVQSVCAMALESLHPLYGTLYLRPFYRLMGMKYGRRAEITTASGLVHDLVSVGEESFVADAAVFGAPRYARGEIVVEETSIGRRSFVGNAALVPTGTRLAEGSLVGVLSRPPAGAAEAGRSGATWFGSPAVLLPKRPQPEIDDAKLLYDPPRRLIAERLAIEALRILLPPTVTALLAAPLLAALDAAVNNGISLWLLAALIPACYAAFGVACFSVVLFLKWVLIGRYSVRVAPLWSRAVWLTEFITTAYESLAVPHLLAVLQGTPYLAPFLRLLGVRIGKRVFLHTTDVTEFDMVEIGDDAALNQNCGPQTHLFEDRIMKIGPVKIGSRSTIGAVSIVLYETELSDDAALGDLSLVMKGETLPAGAVWMGSPARTARYDSPSLK